MINVALSYSPDFFSDPQTIKNPYTNIPFTYAQLLHIYLFIRNNNIINIPILFQLFYLHNFDIDDFFLHNEAMIRNVCINNFIKSATNSDKQYYILKMLNDYKQYVSNFYPIHSQFPQDKLLNAFNSYLKDYLIAKYSLYPSLKFKSENNIISKLSFNRLNPSFGRKIFSRN